LETSQRIIKSDAMMGKHEATGEPWDRVCCRIKQRMRQRRGYGVSFLEKSETSSMPSCRRKLMRLWQSSGGRLSLPSQLTTQGCQRNSFNMKHLNKLQALELAILDSECLTHISEI
jgi:hypothetical protein